jgi:hypothetical protein
MPTTKKNKSPYATSFNSAIKRGTPCFVAVENIAKRTKKTPNQIFESLFKAGLCYRQKIAGQWVYWPCNWNKTNATNAKFCQHNMWQCFIDWCLCCGFCTPEQLHNHCGGQNDFMSYCKKFWSKQFTTGTKTGTKKTRKSTPKARKARKTVSGNYKFPAVKGRKYRKVA